MLPMQIHYEWKGRNTLKYWMQVSELGIFLALKNRDIIIEIFLYNKHVHIPGKEIVNLLNVLKSSSMKFLSTFWENIKYLCCFCWFVCFSLKTLLNSKFCNWQESKFKYEEFFKKSYSQISYLLHLFMTHQKNLPSS